MNQRFAASIAQTYVGWVDHAKWVEEIFAGAICQRRTVGGRSRPDSQHSRQRAFCYCPTDFPGRRAGLFHPSGQRRFHAGFADSEKFAAGPSRRSSANTDSRHFRHDGSGSHGRGSNCSPIEARLKVRTFSHIICRYDHEIFGSSATFAI
jgi:hypothetical protein